MPLSAQSHTHLYYMLTWVHYRTLQPDGIHLTDGTYVVYIVRILHSSIQYIVQEDDDWMDEYTLILVHRVVCCVQFEHIH